MKTLINASVLVVMLMLFAGNAHAEKVYRWIDDAGVSNYTNDPSSIPEKYRDQALTPASPQGSQSNQSSPDSSVKEAPSVPNAIEKISAKIINMDEKGHGEKGGNPVDKSAPPKFVILSAILLGAGSILIIVGWIMMLIRAESVGAGWFVFIFLCGIAPFFFALSHRKLAKPSFLVWLAGCVSTLIGCALLLI